LRRKIWVERDSKWRTLNANKVKIIMKAIVISAVIAGLFIATPLRSHAAPPANVATLLAEAYTDLDHADHDYDGHRIKAMRHIEAAGKLVHLKLGGDGKGHEKQGVSDEQLAAAKNILGQIQSELAGDKKSRILHQVDKAQEELTIALKIK
jgi:hypothetical protein